MHRCLVLVFLLLSASSVFAQGMGGVKKYKDIFFTETTIQKNISYSPGEHAKTKSKHYLFDFYEPASDTTQKRPLVIWLHGGGFKFGSKEAKGIKLWSEMFAQRGYVCAGLNYPLSKKNTLFNFRELKRSCYQSIQDIDEAIAFFKKNHAQYRIDTNHIILAGNSAGAMIALQNVYSNRHEFAVLSDVAAETSSLEKSNPSHVAAVINFWGALFKIEWLNNARVPVFSAYGDRDKLVPPGNKDTSLYGSYSIQQKATQLHIPNEAKVYTGYSHELEKHFNPIFAPSAVIKNRWRDAGQAAIDFLYAQFFSNR